MNDPIRIVQLSDTHFLEDGAEPEGGVAYNTDEAFEAIFDHIGKHENLDLVVVTGDVADHGRRAQYQNCLLYTSPSPRDRTRSRMPSSA